MLDHLTRPEPHEPFSPTPEDWADYDLFLQMQDDDDRQAHLDHVNLQFDIAHFEDRQHAFPV